MRILMLLSFLLIGCNLPDPDPFQYESDGLTISSEIELNVNNMARGTSLAKQMFDAKFGEGSFDALAKLTPVQVKAVDHLECPSPGKCNGLYMHPIVELSHTGTALLHELIHAQQTRNFVITVNHENWDELGYYEMSDQFMIHNIPWFKL